MGQIVRCSKCGENTLALFYPRHKSDRKPKRNEFKCCMECKKVESKIITSPGVDTARIVKEIRNEG